MIEDIKVEKDIEFLDENKDVPENHAFENDDIEVDEPRMYPCIPLRAITIFPNTVVYFDIGREKSMRALEVAMKSDRLLFVSTQIDSSILIPTVNDIYKMGTIVKVKQMLKVNGDVVRVLVEGVRRAKIDTFTDKNAYMECTLYERDETVDEEGLSVKDKAGIRILTKRFMEYAEVVDHISNEALEKIIVEDAPNALVDKIINELKVAIHHKQSILEAEPFSVRIERLNHLINDEYEIALMERTLEEDVKQSIQDNQKEYFLKEQMRVIRRELGDSDDPESEADEWLKKLDELKLPEKIDKKVRREIRKFSRMAASSAESAVVRNYVETIIDLPWNTSSKVNINLNKARKVLDRDHHGLKQVKERVLEHLAVMHLSKSMKGPILCLVGPPGTGKTSVAKSIASATGREFVRLSLGGIRDEAEIRGHRRTYIGAIPGRIINSIKEAGKNNPLFLFDEIDKIGADYKGDPSSALLEVLDPEQNNTFTDHFLEIPFDLSKVMFVTTANSVETIPRPLLDRMEVIRVSGYTEEDKLKIAQKYLIPKKIEEHGLKKGSVKISERAIRDIINYYTRESGVRNLERKIADICRKVAMKSVSSGIKSVSVTPRNLERYLGKKKFRYDVIEGESEIGTVTGLAWTAVGGDTLSVESTVVDGTGKISLTGNLGDVMKESARAGISYVRKIADEVGVEKGFYKAKDIHIHLPEGATPKDGPSAGVTMFTSIVSSLTSIPVKKDIAMTGEITLHGKVLPVGGIKEKVLAANRAGIKKVLLPKDNLKDTEEIPSSVRRSMEFIPISYAKEVLDEALDR